MAPSSPGFSLLQNGCPAVLFQGTNTFLIIQCSVKCTLPFQASVAITGHTFCSAVMVRLCSRPVIFPKLFSKAATRCACKENRRKIECQSLLWAKIKLFILQNA